MSRAILTAGVALALCATLVAAQELSTSDGKVELPSEGETVTRAFGKIANPTMYDVYVVSASTSAAAKVELRRGDEDGALREITVPAYGAVSLSADGVHLRLVDLERPLEAGESVKISLKTDGNAVLSLTAVVTAP